jgi:H/ACA ribonucleoprotein complex subunit 1
MRAIYLENKKQIGKVDDVFGPMHQSGIAIACSDGVKADSFKAGDKVS